jgi:hypothetical protein
MHDVNPLGLIMYLRELEREAAPTLRPQRPAKQHTVSFASFGAAVMIRLQRLYPIAARWTVARHQ